MEDRHRLNHIMDISSHETVSIWTKLSCMDYQNPITSSIFTLAKAGVIEGKLSRSQAIWITQQAIDKYGL